MDKDARFNIAVWIDVQIISSACDASSHILTIILKINGKDRFGAAVLTNPMIHLFSLLWGWKQLRNRIVSNRHIVEKPCKFCSPGNQLIDKLFRADGIKVLAGIAEGHTKWQFLSGCTLYILEVYEQHADNFPFRGGCRYPLLSPPH